MSCGKREKNVWKINKKINEINNNKYGKRGNKKTRYKEKKQEKKKQKMWATSWVKYLLNGYKMWYFDQWMKFLNLLRVIAVESSAVSCICESRFVFGLM